MAPVSPIREQHAVSNPSGICTSAPPCSKSRILCTCKITSYLHISHALKVTCFHGFARFSGLTPAFSIDPKTGGVPGTESSLSSLRSSDLPAVIPMESRLSTLNQEQHPCFQLIAHFLAIRPKFHLSSFKHLRHSLTSPLPSRISFIFNRMYKSPSRKPRVFKPLCNLRGEEGIQVGAGTDRAHTWQTGPGALLTASGRGKRVWKGAPVTASEQPYGTKASG